MLSFSFELSLLATSSLVRHGLLSSRLFEVEPLALHLVCSASESWTPIRSRNWRALTNALRLAIDVMCLIRANESLDDMVQTLALALIRPAHHLGPTLSSLPDHDQTR